MSAAHNLLTAEQERAYGLLWQQDRNPEGLRGLVEHNQGLVRYSVKRFSGHGLDMEDLVSEGTIGLIEAAKRFDPMKGRRFSSYAITFIQGVAMKAVNNLSREIRVPSNKTEKIIKVSRISQRLFQELGREATPEEIQAATGFSAEMVQQLLEIQRNTSTVSMDTPLGEDAATIADLIPAEEPNPQELDASAAIREAVESALGQLDERQVFVLCRRFGLRNCPTLALNAIGELMDPPVSREWVRQIEIAAIAKIKSSLIRRGAV